MLVVLLLLAMDQKVKCYVIHVLLLVSLFLVRIVKHAYAEMVAADPELIVNYDVVILNRVQLYVVLKENQIVVLAAPAVVMIVVYLFHVIYAAVPNVTSPELAVLMVILCLLNIVRAVRIVIMILHYLSVLLVRNVITVFMLKMQMTA